MVFVGMSPLRPKGFAGQVRLRRSSSAGRASVSEKSKLVFVGMSGGVDSSVAALLLKKRGYDTVGVFIRSYNLDGCAERDAQDARRAAERIGIPFYVWDFEEEYKKRVVQYMIDGYRNGITPNPDVMCNKEIKFGLFFDRARAMGADYVATGHYVRLKDGKLFSAKDEKKDQSYFLWTLASADLQHCLFPIGDHRKPEIREIARKGGLPTAEKKDSQGICFLGMVDLFDFLKQHIPEHRGALRTVEGEAIGEHYGSEFYTIGERHIAADFAFPKSGRTARKPFYVAGKDAATNTVVLAEGSDHPALYRSEIELADFHVIDQTFLRRYPAGTAIPVKARVRYRQPLAKALLTIRERGTAVLHFAEPQRFVAPGQSAVCYAARGKYPEMIGGGVIR